MPKVSRAGPYLGGVALESEVFLSASLDRLGEERQQEQPLPVRCPVPGQCEYMLSPVIVP